MWKGKTTMTLKLYDEMSPDEISWEIAYLNAILNITQYYPELDEHDDLLCIVYTSLYQKNIYFAERFRIEEMVPRVTWAGERWA